MIRHTALLMAFPALNMLPALVNFMATASGHIAVFLALRGASMDMNTTLNCVAKTQCPTPENFQKLPLLLITSLQNMIGVRVS